MLPSLESLRCFVAAARSLHFARAARAVALTPAAFGQRIKNLEELVGAPLFTRTTRSVSLTEAGLRLQPAAERILADAALLGTIARGEGELPPTELTLGTRQELGLSFVVPALSVLERELPSLDLHLYFGAGSDLLLRVRTLEIDCAITSTRFTDPKLAEIALHREDYEFVGAPSLLAERPLREAADADGHVLLDASPDLPLFRYLREAPRSPFALARFGRVVRLGSIAAIRARARLGKGVCVLPRYFVRRDLERGTLERVAPRVTLQHDHFRLVFRSDDPRRRVLERLAAVLASQELR